MGHSGVAGSSHMGRSVGVVDLGILKYAWYLGILVSLSILIKTSIAWIVGEGGREDGHEAEWCGGEDRSDR